MKPQTFTQHTPVRAAVIAAALATLVGVTSGSADQGNGQGNGRGQGHGPAQISAEATSVSPQPTPTSVSPQPTPTALSSQPTPTAQPTPASAQSNGPGSRGDGTGSTESLEHRHGITGWVIEKGQGWLRIETASGLAARITVGAETEFRGRGNEGLTFDAIDVGNRVNVQGEPTDEEGDGTLVAHRLRVHADDEGEVESALTAAVDGAEDRGGRGRGLGQGQGRGPKADD